jgi:hypothetical protein
MMTIAKNVMYSASYIYWSEMDRHRLVFSFVMDELVATISKGNSDAMNRHRLTFEFIVD